MKRVTSTQKQGTRLGIATNGYHTLSDGVTIARITIGGGFLVTYQPGVRGYSFKCETLDDAYAVTEHLWAINKLTP